MKRKEQGREIEACPIGRLANHVTLPLVEWLTLARGALLPPSDWIYWNLSLHRFQRYKLLSMWFRQSKTLQVHKLAAQERIIAHLLQIALDLLN